MNAIAHATATPMSGPKLDNRRILAGLIDLLVVGAGGAAILAAAGVVGGGGIELSPPLLAVAVCWGLYYYFACESGAGQTLGKKLMRIRVVRVDGRPAGIGEVAVRSALRVVDTALLGLLVMLATGERRGRLGDLAAGTMVVSIDAGARPAPATATAVAVAAAEAPVIEPPQQDSPLEMPAVETPEVPELPSSEPFAEAQEADQPAADEPTFDFASTTLKELAEDVAAVTGSSPAADPAVEEDPVVEAVPADEAEPAVEAEPVVEIVPVVEVVVEPELVVEAAPAEPELTVKSVETVSAMDLIMGTDESDQDAAAADEHSPDALPQ